MTVRTDVITANGEPIADLGRRLWGDPNKQLSTRDELRFGSHGSKSIKLKERTWFDHEAGEGGGYADLFEKVHGARPADSSIIAAYDYHDAKGKLLYQVVRKIPKTFRQRRPDGNGGWIWDMKGVERVPYRLPDLLRAPVTTPVYLVEGEKDADNLRECGLVATCNPGGARKWLAPMSQYLRGRDVVVLPDNDPDGEAHAADLLTKLRGVARTIAVIRLPDLPPKGDVSDWLGAGGTAEELEELAAEAFKAAPTEQQPNPDASSGIPGLRDFLSIEAWAARDIPPADRLLGDLLTTTSRMFLVGCTGLGKTLLALGMACGIASTDGFLHWRNDRPRRVLVIDGEMPGELIRARSIDAIRRAGIKPVSGYVTIYSRDLEDKFAKLFPSLGPMPPLNDDAGMQWVLDLVAALGGVDCIIFDNVMSLLAGIQKEEEAWKGVEALVLKLTSMRIGQLWLDHTGHDRTRQYGSSTKAWKFDAVGIMTELPDDQKNSREVAFQLSFEPPGKARRRTPDNWQDFETTVIRLAQDEWTSEGASVGKSTGFGNVAPARRVFYDALVAATTKDTTPGRTTMDAWQAECLRRGLIDAPPAGDAKENWQSRDRRTRNFRTAKSELLGARWIAVEDQAVIDLKGRWG